MPPTKGISCLSLVLYGISIGSEDLDSFVYLAYQLTAVHGNILADLLRPLQTLSLELVVANLHSRLVEGEVRIAGDVHAVLVLVGLDSGDRQQGECDPHD